MARFILTGGRVTGDPDVYQNSLQRLKGTSPGFLQNGILAVLGQCEGTNQPQVVVEYDKGAGAAIREELNKGDLYDAVRFAMDPSRNSPNEVRGPTKVLAMRVNPATQSTLDMDNAAAADMINMTSRAYGIAANGVTALNEAGTDGALGRKITIGRTGFTSDVQDNLGFNPALIVRYSGDASTATLAVTATSLDTTLAGDQTDSSVNLSLPYTTYDTVQKLADAINGSISYDAVIYVNNPNTFNSVDMDYVTAGEDILTETGAGMSTTETGTTFTAGAIAGLDAGDIVLIESEYMYVSSIGPVVLIRGYMDTTPVAHTLQAAFTYRPIGKTTQDIITWINTFSQHATAVSDTARGVQQPTTPAATTNFSGAVEGTASSANWTLAFNELRKHYCNQIVITDTTAAVHALFKTHMTYRWGIGAMEAIGACGAAQDETMAQIKTRAKALNDANISLWFQDCDRPNDSNVQTTYAPWAMAAMDMGMRAGVPFGEGVEYKAFNILDLGQNTAIDEIDDSTELITAGLSFARLWDSEFRGNRTLSTWTQDDDDSNIQPDVRNSIAWTLYKVRLRVRERHMGKAYRKGNALSVKSTIKVTLEDIRDNDKAIVEGSQRINGVTQPIPAFTINEINQNGNVIGFSYNFVPAGASLFFNGDSFVDTFEDVA